MTDTPMTPELVQKLLDEAMRGNLFMDQDGDVCIDDGRQFNLIFCPACDDGDIENGWRVLNPDVVVEIVVRYNAAPNLARAYLASEAARKQAEAERDELDFILNEGGEDSVARLIARAEDAEARVVDLEATLQNIVHVGHDCPATFSGDEADWQTVRARHMQAYARAALATAQVKPEGEG